MRRGYAGPSGAVVTKSFCAHKLPPKSQAKDQKRTLKGVTLAVPNIKEEVAKLVLLQNIDKKIFDLKKEKALCPEKVDALQKDFEAKKSHLKNLEDERQKLALKQKQKELDLGAKEDGIKKVQGQLGQLKTNKDYQTKLSEIESLKADKSLIEEDVLKLMEEIDAARPVIEKEKQALGEEEKEFTAQKNEVLSRQKDIDAQLAALDDERKICASSVDKRILGRYEHILPAKEGVALVPVVQNSCQGCFMHVPHQVVNEIKMHEHLITCEVCSRILYLEEDVNS
jgi:predicted  nucleic acid-binding Zn-ribbon protein